MPTKKSEYAAADIFKRYEKYLAAQHMGNQDPDCCIREISLIIEKHYGTQPGASLQEALNSGDGSYKP